MCVDFYVVCLGWFVGDWIGYDFVYFCCWFMWMDVDWYVECFGCFEDWLIGLFVEIMIEGVVVDDIIFEF